MCSALIPRSLVAGIVLLGAGCASLSPVGRPGEEDLPGAARASLARALDYLVASQVSGKDAERSTDPIIAGEWPQYISMGTSLGPYRLRDSNGWNTAVIVQVLAGLPSRESTLLGLEATDADTTATCYLAMKWHEERERERKEGFGGKSGPSRRLSIFSRYRDGATTHRYAPNGEVLPPGSGVFLTSGQKGTEMSRAAALAESQFARLWWFFRAKGPGCLARERSPFGRAGSATPA